MASIIAVSNETKSTGVRTTKDGRTIRYTLNVIQQPERARACGSGAKSSADRRPVDPPPIVELRVYEGDNDITCAYNANFFLFATLENARTMAPGRAPPSGANFPVLTGTPVAGMAYLDRPSPAGYFIFPDLSVRHEGKYRLSFALYEELKDPKDMDPEDRSTVNAHPQGGVDAHVSHRLEVKSLPFVVFSAKKFPGLSESTALSRTVAEQGCRVRIRRDVRMRRRENKSNKEWEEDEDAGYEGGYRRTATPDAYGQQQQGLPATSPALDADNRPRSVSNASNNSFAAPRRQSMEEMAQPYQPTTSYQQMPPPQSTAYSQMPQYASSQPPYQSQQYAPPQPPPQIMQPPQTPSYASHPPHQAHQPAHSYQSQPSMHMGQNYGYVNNQSYPQSHYDQPAPVRHDSSVDYGQPAPEFRRPSVPQTSQPYSSPTPSMSPYAPMDYGRLQQMPQPIQPLQSPTHAPTPTVSHMSNGHSIPAIPPIRTVLAPVGKEKLEPISPSFHSPPNTMSAPMSATSEHAPHNGYPDSRAKYAPQVQQIQPQSSLGQKRSFSSTFDTQHLNERLQQGARPNPGALMYGPDPSFDESDMESPLERSAMSYRRADGTERRRQVPMLGT